MIPAAAGRLVAFTQLLRGHGFALAHDQIVSFLKAVTLLGPRDLGSISQAAVATLAPQRERRAEFDALFHAFFHEEAAIASAAQSIPEDEAPEHPGHSGGDDAPDTTEANESGQAASGGEILSRRNLFPATHDALTRLARFGPQALPRRRGFRRSPDARKGAIDLRRSVRTILAHDGDLLRLMRTRRQTVQRRVILLVDVSGSMKNHTADYLRYAHALLQIAPDAECYTFGTRLTRITRALRHPVADVALARASAVVADWDGGTRIGEALATFLARPQRASLIRGAMVIVLSDGLERGDHALMTAAVRSIGRRAHKLLWLTPLAADPRFRPETQAIKSILPFLTGLGDGGSLDALVDNTLKLGARP
ncbi:VWA domain-containing protein [soil metagenome]